MVGLNDLEGLLQPKQFYDPDTRSGSDAGQHGFLSSEVHLWLRCRHLRICLWHSLRLAAQQLGVSEKLNYVLEMVCWKC